MERKYAMTKKYISDLLSDDELKSIPTMQEEILKIISKKRDNLIKNVLESYLQRPITSEDTEKVAIKTEDNQLMKCRSVLTYDSEILGYINSYTELKDNQSFYTVEFIPRGRNANEPVLDSPPQPCQGCGS